MPDVRLLALAAHAYVRARWRAWRLRDRAAIEAYQTRQLTRLMQHASHALPFYRAYAQQPLAQWPILDKQALLADFERINRPALGAGDIREALAAGQERARGYVIGQSTGTSGNRGYYVISDAERFVWLGTLLAKALPDALWQRRRVALALPGLSALYRSAGTGSRIELAFFDLASGPQSWVEALSDFAPDTLVAPPKVLRWLAERGRLQARNVFSGAEVLDPLDRQVIEAATGRRLREIYMATEGLFAVSCSRGTLHLAEDVVHFEFQQVDAHSPLVSPIVTDFTRREQGLIRYRMNDLLELDPNPCPCGLAFQAVKRVEGRQDDVFRLADGQGGRRLVTPDVLRNAVVDSHPAIVDFRVLQLAAERIEVRLDECLPAEVDEQVRQNLLARLAPLAVEVQVVRGLEVPYAHKLRRVMRLCD
ncbi:MAG: hypothetical protein GAK43_01430 [Stenotrophomonas maltophilia]|nr:MAG: hypothetical protein GAK43_01430 [Stenotrophomonas maltophilia]